MNTSTATYARKLSPEMRRLLLHNHIPGDRRLNVLVQTRREPSPHELRELVHAGAHIRTVARDVLTGDIAAADVPKLAAKPYVVRVEMSRPLFCEED